MKRDRRLLVGMAVHPPQLAATRLRLTQFFPYFEEAGFECQLWTFLTARDLKWWHGSSNLARVAVIMRALLRVPRALLLLLRSDVVLVQRECMPFGPPVLEWLAARRSTLIWDVDDFVWERYISPTAGSWTTWLRAPEGKHDRICRWAQESWAGSDAIAEWMRRRGGTVRFIPTVVEVPPTRSGLDRRAPSAAWVGTHSTAPFLDAIMPEVSRCKGLNALVVVGAKSTRQWPFRVEEWSWSLEAEIEACTTTRVGLYPVDIENPYAEGKCGLKAILYMAYGLPCVVTPTRPNAAIVRDNVDGLHARSALEFRTAIERLLTDDDLWDSLSESSYKRARDEYSVQTWAPRIVRHLVQIPTHSSRLAGCRGA